MTVCSRPRTVSPYSRGAVIDSPRNVILVVFRSSATAEQRRAAIESICGRVVGGWRIGDRDGYYVVEVKTDGTATALWRAIDHLAAQPGVESAEPNIPEVSPLGRH